MYANKIELQTIILRFYKRHKLHSIRFKKLVVITFIKKKLNMNLFYYICK